MGGLGIIGYRGVGLMLKKSILGYTVWSSKRFEFLISTFHVFCANRVAVGAPDATTAVLHAISTRIQWDHSQIPKPSKKIKKGPKS